MKSDSRLINVISMSDTLEGPRACASCLLVFGASFQCVRFDWSSAFLVFAFIGRVGKENFRNLRALDSAEIDLQNSQIQL